jgi:hypothetical protein
MQQQHVCTHPRSQLGLSLSATPDSNHPQIWTKKGDALTCTIPMTGLLACGEMMLRGTIMI